MDQLTSPQGSIALAIAASLLVLGYRLARPTLPRAWLGVIAYAVGLGGQILGAAGVLGGSVPTPGGALRVLGAASLVTGLIVAGSPVRVRRRAWVGDRRALAPGMTATHTGLALVLVGQFLRGPSMAGAAPVAVGIAVNASLSLLAQGPRTT